MCDMIFSSVFERHPRLPLAIVEFELAVPGVLSRHVSLADGKSLLGAHSRTNARLPIMPDLTGLGSVAGTPMHSVDSVRTVFHRSRGIFQLRTTHAP
jgi:hypothetical protein